MPRANLSGYSNADAGEHVIYGEDPNADTRPVNEDGESLNKDGSVSKRQPTREGDDESSAGTNSLTSERTPDKSGTSSGTDPQSPAPTTDSPSSKDQPPSQESSTARSTAGSGRVTSSDRPSPQVFSAASAAGAPATPAQPTKGGKRGSSS